MTIPGDAEPPVMTGAGKLGEDIDRRILIGRGVDWGDRESCRAVLGAVPVVCGSP